MFFVCFRVCRCTYLYLYLWRESGVSTSPGIDADDVVKKEKPKNKKKIKKVTNDDWDRWNINDDRDTQREITDWDTGAQMTTGSQGI